MVPGAMLQIGEDNLKDIFVILGQNFNLPSKRVCKELHVLIPVPLAFSVDEKMTSEENFPTGSRD